MKYKSKLAIMILLLILAIGFAAVSTTLVINGTAVLGINDEDFNVIFTRAIIDGVNISDTTISEDRNSITFVTKDLSKVDDISVLNFTVRNNSTQYDATIKMECKTEGQNSTYYEVTNTIPNVIVAKTSENGSVTVRLKKASVNEISETFTCTITANAVERNEEPELIPVSMCDGNICWTDEDANGIKSLGDVISIGNEKFYILDVNDGNVKMLSMFNLAVGNVFTTDEAYTPVENANGIQNSQMIGYPPTGGYPRYGTTSFGSSVNYAGSSIELLVANYSDYIKNTLGVDNSATLISKADLEKIAGTQLEPGPIREWAPTWLYSSSYWAITPYDEENVWGIFASGGFNTSNRYYGHGFGVRPVVIISSSLV